MTDVSLNGLALSVVCPAALVLRVARQLTGARRTVFVDVPGRAGSWVYPERPGDRTLTVVVDITASSFEDRREAVRQLAYWADPGTVARLIVDDEEGRYHDAILDAGVDVDEWLTAAREISVPFRVGPYALAELPTVETVTAVGSPDSGAFNVVDTVEALPVIEITPTGGYMTTFSITVNGATLTWGAYGLGPRPNAPHINEDEVPATSPDGGLLTDFQGPSPGVALYADGYVYDGFGFRQSRLASGATITISALSDTVTLGASTDVDLTGAFNPGSVDMSTVTGEFPRLLEGANPWALEYIGTATGASIEFTWRERFR